MGTVQITLLTIEDSKLKETVKSTVETNEPGEALVELVSVADLTWLVTERETVIDTDAKITNITGCYLVYTGNDPKKEGDSLVARWVPNI